MTQQLIRYDAAVRALAECKAVDEVKDWHDKAAAMQAYGRIAKDKALETDAAEIRIRAERRLGEMIASQKAAGGLNTGAKGIGKSAVPTGNRTPTLAEAGIDKKLSARAQKLAAVPESQFEAEVGEWRDRVSAEGVRVTARLEAAGEAAIAAAPAKPEEKPEAPVDDAQDDILRDYENLVEENKTLRAIVESTDAGKAALAEVKRLTEVVRVLEERNRGLMNEKNQALEQAKMWMRKAQRAEKAAKEAAEGVAF